jgi:hypothetical protein
MQKIKLFLLVALCLLLLPGKIYAASASLSLSPTSGAYTVGDSFSLEVRMNSDVTVSTWQVKLTYDSSVLTYQSIEYNPTFESKVEETITAGSILASRFSLSGGASGNVMLMKVTFKSSTVKDSTAVNFSQSECFIYELGQGTNILSSVANGSYAIKSAPAGESTSSGTITTATSSGTTVYISKSKSTIKTDKTEATADGKDAITLSITVRDSNGNVVKDKKPTVTISGSDNKLSELTLTGDDWVATLTSTKAEEKTITVKIDKTTLGTTKVTFIAPSIPATPTIQPTPIEKPPISITKLPSLMGPYQLYIAGSMALLLTIGYLVYSILKRRRSG